jgi:Zn-dependent peptidase ImmA (M78 family)
LYLNHPSAGKCVLINYSEDVYRQRFTASHEAGHAILDVEEDFVVSFEKWDKSDLVEVRANAFAANFLVPPEFIRHLPKLQWTESAIVDWANRLRVNVEVLLISLQREGQLDKATAAQFRGLKIPWSAKIDPELPLTLSESARRRKTELLRRGLSSYYVVLCFESYNRHLISAGRLAEMILADEADLKEIGTLYGWSPKHGD